jgi:hypothetical protein
MLKCKEKKCRFNCDGVCGIFREIHKYEDLSWALWKFNCPLCEGFVKVIKPVWLPNPIWIEGKRVDCLYSEMWRKDDKIKRARQ